MKKFFILGVLCISILSSCDNSKQQATEQELANQKALNEASREELQNAIAERDELLDLVNEVTASINDIKGVEKVITVSATGTDMNSRGSVSSDLASIKSTLAERRQKLSDLEAKLKSSKVSNDKLLATITNLRSQIDDLNSQVESLTSKLTSANETITKLDSKVDSLNTTVASVTEERNTAQEEAVKQADIANQCFYAIGSKSELKKHDIIESGFLRKTKIMQGDFDKSFFVQADKRTLTSIQLHSNKAKVVSTTQPKSSYEIVDVNGQKVLRILNPSEFWGVSNYVVIQID